MFKLPECAHRIVKGESNKSARCSKTGTCSICQQPPPILGQYPLTQAELTAFPNLA